MKLSQFRFFVFLVFSLSVVELKSAQAGEPFQIEHSTVVPIESKLLGRRYEAYVKTPPGYDAPENRSRTYPVLYMTDGAYTFQVASAITMVPFNHNRLKQFIIVGISNTVNEDPAAARRRDLTPWVMEKYGQTGESAKYLEFLKRELIPTVENKYRIDPDRRVLSGQSLGGSFGLWVAFTEPSLFGSYVLTSPSIWWAKHALLDVEANYARNHKDLKAKIFLAVGQMERPGECQTCTADMAGGVETIAQRLRSRKYPSLQLKSEVTAGTYHETTFPIGLTKGLQWLFLGPGD